MTDHAVDPTYAIRRLLPRHYEVMDLLLAGHEYKTISETLGIGVSTIKMLVRSPLFDTELDRRRREAKNEVIGQLDRSAALGKAESILQEGAAKAAATLEGILDSDDDGLRLRAASAILDRVFAKDSGGGTKVVVNVTADQINLLHLALQESKHAAYAANSPSAQAPQADGTELYEASWSTCPPADGSGADLAVDQPSDVH
jgi:hypothetical protein